MPRFVRLVVLIMLATATLLGARPAHAVTTIVYVNAAAAPGGNGQAWNTAYQSLQDALINANPAAADTVESGWRREPIARQGRRAIGTPPSN